MQGLLWFYRYDDVRARIAAGIVAFWFGRQLLVELGQMSIDVPVSRLTLGFTIYWLVSHGLFALFGRTRNE